MQPPFPFMPAEQHFLGLEQILPEQQVSPGLLKQPPFPPSPGEQQVKDRSLHAAQVSGSKMSKMCYIWIDIDKIIEGVDDLSGLTN
jgi:hypothetical protein